MSKIYQYIYEFREVWGHTCSIIHFFLLFKKIEKVQEHDPYLNQILHHLDLKSFFLRWITKIFGKGGPTPISLRSEFSSSNWFHSNTRNSRHVFNTNVYLIHFHSKNNIKICFPKSWVFSFKPTTCIHCCGEINWFDISKDFTTACQWNIFKKN